jgi:hypothetical protein
MADEYVQVSADGAGKRIRNVSLDVPQSDGSVKTVYMQVVNVRDEAGNPIQFSDADLLKSIYLEIRALRMMYGRATGQAFVGLPAQTDDAADVG